ncbi:MAG TPA: glycoside hydrolase family 3 N-terminal domain-containing protein [Thermoanaerobaculia bacterium]|jgi:beta-glucosidase|nr:glycoside hydrolase family 3 N-terminal domain-containing protein [Thermoanaerobaculia bacterium]
MQRTVARFFILLFTLAAHADEARIEALLRQMTLEEKLGQLSQYGPDQPEMKIAIEKGLVGSVLGAGSAKQVNELQRVVLAGSRLKIPLLVGHDVIHGHRTIFPIPLAIASSWDVEAAEASARIAAREARAAGIHWTFAPMVDIARDPRWGRIAEGAGEDPFLGSAMAAAYVRGFQGEKLLACAKHFAAYGAAEGGRDYARADISEATLREVYLPPFQAAVDAGVASLMSAFNTVGNVPASANEHLLRDVLRKEWGFKGFVVSDYTAIQELMNHGIAATKGEAARKAIAAGVDMAMVDGTYMHLEASPLVDDAVRRVLRAKFAAGMFDNPFVDESREIPLARAEARRVAQRSIVLLKNNDALLPLAKNKKIAVVGSLAESKEDMLGAWACVGRAEETVSVLEGLRAAGANVVAQNDADVIVAVFGETREMSGEAASRASLDLPQEAELEALVAIGKPVVLVVMAGRPLAISWAAQHVPSIVYAWHLGTEGGNAIADVLFGVVNPNGKLPVTFPRVIGQVPVYHAQHPTGRPPDVESKWTSKYFDIPIEPLFAFGHGLSYTRFEYANLKIDGMTVSVDVRNAGQRAGDEVVQLYVRDVVASVSRPVKELKGFRRIALNPGETKRVTFTLTPRDLAFWTSKGWTTEPGEFQVWVGTLTGTMKWNG